MEGASALVTGASHGLGAFIARRLGRDGWPVGVNYPPAADGERTRALAVVADIRAAGGTAEAVAADVTDEEQVRALVAQTAAALGPVDVLVVNATGPQPATALEDLTWRAHLDQLEFFVKSPTLLVQAVLPHMKQRGSGRIVQIGSDMPERAVPGSSAYAAAKAAQLSLTRVWARELGPHGITVNLVAPGWIPVERHAGSTARERDGYLAGVPLGRFGAPEDIAAAVSYLASDAARFVTGARLPVNGGEVFG
jgi:NAD(P)-dependent dehydrogenase (short-subunit alcohol dehydrogenase family)